jgi:cephalosporin hydroxylase
MRPNTLRSRPRRSTAPSFFTPRSAEGEDGVPESSVPVPQGLKDDAITAFWNSLAWRQTSWLGQRVQRPPSDLFVYQELISRLRPDWIIETGTGNGGRALFLASICELLGHGVVLSVASKASDKRPHHERIRYLTGVPHDEATGAQVREIVGTEPHALVVLGSRGSRQRTLAEFDVYAPLVPVGSYVIVEDTIVNGHPVWTGFGPGPLEAVKGIVNRRANFSPDNSIDRYLVTFNPSGFLKRVQ